MSIRLNRVSNPSQNESQSTTSSSSRSTSISQMPNVSQHPSISLIECVEFKIDGNINKNAVILADCDDDSRNELLVGTLSGELLVYKDNVTTPYACVKDLGMIAAIVVGDILNQGKQFITTLSVDGMLNVFGFLNETAEGESGSFNQETIRRNSNFSSSSHNKQLEPVFDQEVLCSSTSHQQNEYTNKLIREHTQQIQANGMGALIADIDNDGLNEFVVTLTDRVMRSYRAVQYGKEIKLVGIHKWEFSDQIGSISLANVDSIPESVDETNEVLPPNTTKHNILVSQYGGMYARLSCFESYREVRKSETNEENEIITKNLTPEYKNLAQSLMRNPQISAEIICDINNGEGKSLIALATSDGLLILMDEKNILWHIQLESKVLSLKKLDIDNDGRDELVVCTWSGRAFIVNLDGQILTCHFDQPVSSFDSGLYNIGARQHKAFVFCTFTNSIFLYYNLDFDFKRRFKTNTLIEHLKQHKPEIIALAQKRIDKINAERRGSKEPEVKFDSKFISYLLYDL